MAICNVLDQLVITCDPTDFVKKLDTLFSERIALQTIFIKQMKPTDLTPDEFLKMILSLMNLDSQQMREVIGKEPSEWTKSAQILELAKQSDRPLLLQSEERFEKIAEEDGIMDEFDEMRDRCRELAKLMPHYSYNVFQAYVATELALDDK